MEHLTCAQRTQ